jgi:hypothetical protein
MRVADLDGRTAALENELEGLREEAETPAGLRNEQRQLFRA